MTSPRSCSVPTTWTPSMRGWSPVAVTTGPATRKISPAPLTAAFSALFIAMSCSFLMTESLVEIDSDGPLDLLAQVLFLPFPHRDHDRPGRRLEPPPHRVAQGAHVLRA